MSKKSLVLCLFASMVLSACGPMQAINPAEFLTAVVTALFVAFMLVVAFCFVA